MAATADAKARRADEKAKARAEKERVKSLAQMAKTNLLDDLKKIGRQTRTLSNLRVWREFPFKAIKVAEGVPTTGPSADYKDEIGDLGVNSNQLGFGENGKGITVQFSNYENSSAQLQELIAACQPALFGRGGEAVLDETYRKAGKLDRDAFATTFCPYEAGIIDDVAQLLLPQLKHDKYLRRVKAELYKLNIDSAPCGKFQAHVDTLRSKDQFGSLVVALPAANKGGALAVRNAGKEIVFASSTEGELCNDQNNPKSTVKWAAFYSECEHEVYEVTDGHRVTFTYNLYMTRGLRHLAGSPSALDPTQLPMYKALEGALQIPRFLRGGRVLATWLSHSYAHTNKHTNSLPSSLKGADMSLYETVRALGLKCITVPIITVGGYYSGEEHVLKGKFCGFNEGYSGDGFSFDESEAVAKFSLNDVTDLDVAGAA